MKSKLTKKEEKELLNLVLAQDIEFYNSYLEQSKSQLNDCSEHELLKMASIQIAIESVWISLTSLKEVIND